MSSFSSFLFARPSFVEGVGRLVDVGNALNVYNVSPDAASADTNAASADWQAVGDCIKTAILRYSRSLERRASRQEDRSSVQALQPTK